MKKISPNKITNVISLLNQGFSYNMVAARLSLSKATVHRIKKVHLPYHNHAQPGRPKSLTPQQEQLIVQKLISRELDNAVDITKHLQDYQQTHVNANTVRRALKRSGLKAASMVKKPVLQPKHIRARLAFAERHKYWTTEDWKHVIWSDETKINCLGSDGRKWCWKKPKMAFQHGHIQPTLKHSGGSIMIWGCMIAEGPGFATKINDQMNAELYCSILEDELEQTMEWYGLEREKIIFQHDNDPKHTTKMTQEYLKKSNLQILEWPAQLPDLNPIEHLWHLLKRRLSKYEKMPSGILKLSDRVEVEWNNISKEECMHLIESMPRRVAAVLKARGGYTKY